MSRRKRSESRREDRLPTLAFANPPLLPLLLPARRALVGLLTLFNYVERIESWRKERLLLHCKQTRLSEIFPRKREKTEQERDGGRETRKKKRLWL